MNRKIKALVLGVVMTAIASIPALAAQYTTFMHSFSIGKTELKVGEYTDINAEVRLSKEAMTVKDAKGAVTYKLVGVTKSKFKKNFSVNAKNGKITVKNGTKKGTYTLKIKVSAAGDASYKAVEKTVKVKIVVE